MPAYESPRPEPWTLDEAEPHVGKLLQAIVGFRIEITRLERRWKLGHNHPKERRKRVIRVLDAEPGEDSKAIADLMREGSR